MALRVFVATILFGWLSLGTAYEQQIILSSNTHEAISSGLHSGNASHIVNMTFDDIDLHKICNETLHNTKFLEFERFEVINTTAAAAKGFIGQGDMNCAQSKPNAIRSIPQQYPAASIIKSNRTALEAAGMSPYFDLVSFTLKPLGPAPTWMLVSITAWEIDGREPKNIQDLFLFWGEDEGYLDPFPMEPRQYFENWGEKVNWVEIEAQTSEGEHWEVCVDDVVLQFHEQNDDGEVASQAGLLRKVGVGNVV